MVGWRQSRNPWTLLTPILSPSSSASRTTSKSLLAAVHTVSSWMLIASAPSINLGLRNSQISLLWMLGYVAVLASTVSPQGDRNGRAACILKRLDRYADLPGVDHLPMPFIESEPPHFPTTSTSRQLSSMKPRSNNSSPGPPVASSRLEFIQELYDTLSDAPSACS